MKADRLNVPTKIGLAAVGLSILLGGADAVKPVSAADVGHGGNRVASAASGGRGAPGARCPAEGLTLSELDTMCSQRRLLRPVGPTLIGNTGMTVGEIMALPGTGMRRTLTDGTVQVFDGSDWVTPPKRLWKPHPIK